MSSETPVQLMRQSVIGDGNVCHARLGHGFHWNPDESTLTEENLTGTCMHAILEAQALLQRDGAAYQGWDVAMATAIHELESCTRMKWRTEKDGTTGDIDTVVDRAVDMAEFYIEKHWLWDPAEFTIIGVELRFQEPWLDGWDASGTVDVLAMDQAGWLYVGDYKGPRNKKRAGWEKPANSPQMAWYFHWVRKWWQRHFPDDFAAHGPRPMKGIYEVISWGTELAHRRYEATVSPVEHDFVMRQAERFRQLVEQGPEGLFIPNTTSLCDHRWCDYWYVCEAGEALHNA
ncbi:MAG: hypothetical protein HKO53_01405 [Gemmatimonadetes bacterium]|nr:hypothetical protein [Gemmatimonadota bacterium]